MPTPALPIVEGSFLPIVDGSMACPPSSIHRYHGSASLSWIMQLGMPLQQLDQGDGIVIVFIQHAKLFYDDLSVTYWC